MRHAVWCARRLIGDEPFAVMLPDDVIAAVTRPGDAKHHQSGAMFLDYEA